MGAQMSRKQKIIYIFAYFFVILINLLIGWFGFTYASEFSVFPLKVVVLIGILSGLCTGFISITKIYLLHKENISQRIKIDNLTEFNNRFDIITGIYTEKYFTQQLNELLKNRGEYGGFLLLEP